MSRQHWIDEFFRKRLERRMYPVEKGEYDEVQALLQARNGNTALIRGVRFSKWWLSALIPMAGLLGWVVGRNADGTELHLSQAAEQVTKDASIAAERGAQHGVSTDNRMLVPVSSSEPNAQVSRDVVERAISERAGSMPTGEEAMRAGKVPDGSTSFGAEAPADGDKDRSEVRGTAGIARSAGGVGRHERGKSNDRVTDDKDPRLDHSATETRDQGLSHTSPDNEMTGHQDALDPPSSDPADGSHATVTVRRMAPSEAVGALDEKVALPSGKDEDPTGGQVAMDDKHMGTTGAQEEAAKVGGDRRANIDEGDGAARNDAASVQSEPGGMKEELRPGSAVGDRADPDRLSARSLDHGDAASYEMSARRISDVGMMASVEPRLPEPLMAEARLPEHRSFEVIKFLSAGELHVFGSPLFVRTRMSNGDRSEREQGSLFGFEYRVRVKRFAWATGIYYGTYGLRTDQGATDVRLSFVELPLLASVKLLRGRFGILVQGGMSADLLFNATGRYAIDGDLASGALPEEAFRTANYSWILRPQATYHVSEHLSLSAGPLWKAQLGEVAHKGSQDGARVNSSGVAIGVSWRLERATF